MSLLIFFFLNLSHIFHWNVDNLICKMMKICLIWIDFNFGWLFVFDEFTCDVCCPFHRVQIVLRLCWSPFVNLIHLHERAIELPWMFARFCQPFLVLMLVQWILDAFESSFFVCEREKNGIRNRNCSLHSLQKLTRRAKAYKDNVTCGMLRRSNKSAVWKISSSGNPYFLIAAWKRWMFSINWKLVPRSWIFFTEPAVNLLANLHKTIPSFKISSYWPAGTFSPKTAKIHSNTSFSWSLLRG